MRQMSTLRAPRRERKTMPAEARDRLIAAAQKLLKRQPDAAAEILFEVVESQALDHEAFALLGEALMAKSNFAAAANMFAQAALLAPDIADYRAKRTLAEHQRAITQEKACETEHANRAEAERQVRARDDAGKVQRIPAAFRRFEFVVVPGSPIMGCVAIRAYLNMHPDVCVASMPDTDFKFMENREIELLAEWQYEMTRHPNRKYGLAHHGVIAHVFRDDDGTSAARTASIAQADYFIQIVRHPFSALRSMYEQRLWFQTHFNFQNCCRNWISGQRLAPGQPAKFDESFEPVIDFPFRGPVDQIDGWCARTVRFFESGNAYNLFFPRWEIFDLDDFFPDKIDASMSRMYNMLGVNPDFTHPRFTMAGASLPQKFMGQDIMLHVGDYPLRFRLCYSGADPHEGEPPIAGLNMPIWISAPPAEWMEAGFENWPLGLLVYKDDWYAMPLAQRDRFLEEQAESVLTFIALSWARTYNAVMAAGASERFDRVPRSALSSGWRIIQPDIEKFLSRFPESAARWGNVEERFCG